MKKCSVIYNPISTNYKEENIKKICDYLKKQKYKVSLFESNYPGRTKELIKQVDSISDLVLTIGGDGTLGEAMQGYKEINQKSLYSHISTGTTNDAADNFGLNKEDPLESLQLILNGKPRKVDLVTANDEAFAYVSIFGYLSNITYETKVSSKQKFGHIAYIFSGIKELIKRPEKYHISYTTKEGTKEVTCILGVVSNAHVFGGFNIYEDNSIDDGKFEVLFLKKAPFKLVRTIFHDYIRHQLDLKKYKEYIECFQTDQVKIKFLGQLPKKSINHDGDEASILITKKNRTLEYKIPKKIKMLLPITNNNINKNKKIANNNE